MELPKNLKPLKSLEANKSLYAKIRRRQLAGTMTTYIVDGWLYYDENEEKAKVKEGRPLKGYVPQKKGIINLTNDVYNLKDFVYERKNFEDKGE